MKEVGNSNSTSNKTNGIIISNYQENSKISNKTCNVDDTIKNEDNITNNISSTLNLGDINNKNKFFSNNTVINKDDKHFAMKLKYNKKSKVEFFIFRNIY